MPKAHFHVSLGDNSQVPLLPLMAQLVAAKFGPDSVKALDRPRPISPDTSDEKIKEFATAQLKFEKQAENLAMICRRFVTEKKEKKIIQLAQRAHQGLPLENDPDFQRLCTWVHPHLQNDSESLLTKEKSQLLRQELRNTELFQEHEKSHPNTILVHNTASQTHTEKQQEHDRKTEDKLTNALRQLYSESDRTKLLSVKDIQQQMAKYIDHQMDLKDNKELEEVANEISKERFALVRRTKVALDLVLENLNTVKLDSVKGETLNLASSFAPPHSNEMTSVERKEIEERLIQALDIHPNIECIYDKEPQAIQNINTRNRLLRINLFLHYPEAITTPLAKNETWWKRAAKYWLKAISEVRECKEAGVLEYFHANRTAGYNRVAALGVNFFKEFLQQLTVNQEFTEFKLDCTTLVPDAAGIDHLTSGHLTALAEHLEKAENNFPYQKLTLRKFDNTSPNTFNEIERLIVAANNKNIQLLTIQYPLTDSQAEALYKRMTEANPPIKTFVDFESEHLSPTAKNTLHNIVARNIRLANQEDRRRSLVDSKHATPLPAPAAKMQKISEPVAPVRKYVTVKRDQVDINQLDTNIQVQEQLHQQLEQQVEIQKVHQTQHQHVIEEKFRGNSHCLDYKGFINSIQRRGQEVASQLKRNRMLDASFDENNPDLHQLKDHSQHLWANVTGGLPPGTATRPDLQGAVGLQNRIEYITLAAADQMVKFMHVFTGGVNRDNLPQGFFLARNNSGFLILDFDAHREVKHHKDSVLTPKLVLPEEAEEIWRGDSRQFASADEKGSKEALTTFVKSSLNKDSFLELLKKENPSGAAAIAENVIWGNLSLAEYKSLWTVFYKFGCAGVQDVLTQLQSAQENLGDRYFTDFKACFLTPKSDWSFVLQSEFAQNISRITSLNESQLIWWRALTRQQNSNNPVAGYCINLSEQLAAFNYFCGEYKTLTGSDYLPVPFPLMDVKNLKVALNNVLLVLRNASNVQEQVAHLDGLDFNDSTGVTYASRHDQYHFVSEAMRFNRADHRHLVRLDDNATHYKVDYEELKKSVRRSIAAGGDYGDVGSCFTRYIAGRGFTIPYEFYQEIQGYLATNINPFGRYFTLLAIIAYSTTGGRNDTKTMLKEGIELYEKNIIALHKVEAHEGGAWHYKLLAEFMEWNTVQPPLTFKEVILLFGALTEKALEGENNFLKDGQKKEFEKETSALKHTVSLYQEPWLQGLELASQHKPPLKFQEFNQRFENLVASVKETKDEKLLGKLAVLAAIPRSHSEEKYALKKEESLAEAVSHLAQSKLSALENLLDILSTVDVKKTWTQKPSTTPALQMNLFAPESKQNAKHSADGKSQFKLPEEKEFVELINDLLPQLKGDASTTYITVLNAVRKKFPGCQFKQSRGPVISRNNLLAMLAKETKALQDACNDWRDAPPLCKNVELLTKTQLIEISETVDKKENPRVHTAFLSVLAKQLNLELERQIEDTKFSPPSKQNEIKRSLNSLVAYRYPIMLSDIKSEKQASDQVHKLIKSVSTISAAFPQAIEKVLTALHNPENSVTHLNHLTDLLDCLTHAPQPFPILALQNIIKHPDVNHVISDAKSVADFKEATQTIFSQNDLTQQQKETLISITLYIMSSTKKTSEYNQANLSRCVHMLCRHYATKRLCQTELTALLNHTCKHGEAFLLPLEILSLLEDAPLTAKRFFATFSAAPDRFAILAPYLKELIGPPEDKYEKVSQVNKPKVIATLEITAAFGTDPKFLSLLPLLLNEETATLEKLSVLCRGSSKPRIEVLIHESINHTLSNYLATYDQDPHAKRNNFKTNPQTVLDVIQNMADLTYGEGDNLSYALKNTLFRWFSVIDKMGSSDEHPIYYRGGTPLSAKNLNREEISALIKQYRAQIGTASGAEKLRIRLAFLTLAREVMYRTTGKMPNSTQILAVLNAMMQDGNVLSEVPTGQGKGLICALHASMLWLEGRTVDVCTSDISYAKRDLEDHQHFYDDLGADTSLITVNSQPQDHRRGGINYSSVEHLSLNRSRLKLIGEFKEDKHIALVLDEADFTLLDDSMKHRVTDMTQDTLDENGESSLKDIYFGINALIDGKEFQQELQKHNSYDLDAARNGLMKLVPSQRMCIANLQKISDKQLSTWISSALVVSQLKEGKDFVIKQETKIVNSVERDVFVARLIIHERLDPQAQLGLGMQPLLHARREKELREQEKKSEQYSGIHFPIEPEYATMMDTDSRAHIKYYQKQKGPVVGYTGTVGSKSEREELREKYAFKISRTPSHQPRLRIDRPPVLTNNPKEHKEKIAEEIKSHLRGVPPGQPILITCPDVASSQEMYNYVQEVLSHEMKGQYAGIQLLHAKTATVTPGNSTEKISPHQSEQSIVKRAGGEGWITISSVLGRGTHIETEHKKGLFVIVSSADSFRSQEQAKGRAGRQGKPGETILIANGGEFKNKNLDAKREADAILQQQQRNFRECQGDIKGYFLNLFENILHAPMMRAYRESQIIFKTAWSEFLSDIDRQWSELLTQSLPLALCQNSLIEYAVREWQNLLVRAVPRDLAERMEPLDIAKVSNALPLYQEVKRSNPTTTTAVSRTLQVREVDIDRAYLDLAPSIISKEKMPTQLWKTTFDEVKKILTAYSHSWFLAKDRKDDLKIVMEAVTACKADDYQKLFAAINQASTSSVEKDWKSDQRALFKKRNITGSRFQNTLETARQTILKRCGAKKLNEILSNEIKAINDNVKVLKERLGEDKLSSKLSDVTTYENTLALLRNLKEEESSFSNSRRDFRQGYQLLVKKCEEAVSLKKEMDDLSDDAPSPAPVALEVKMDGTTYKR
jgi:hypothetical protein